jgi:NADPH:quinone reductase-like Zn-dependent oxidoreductase
MTMLKSYYEHRGPVPQDVIRAVEFTPPALTTGQALVAVLAAPINPSDVLMLTANTAGCRHCPPWVAAKASAAWWRSALM